MKVYVLLVDLDYGAYEKEDHEIVGVYRTLASANDAMRKNMASHFNEDANPEGLDECLARRRVRCPECVTRYWKIEEHELED
jgi:hypothetical protein